jgi:protein involved in polysaccharide export with SLBB domain
VAVSKVVRHIVSNGALLAACALFSGFFAVQAQAQSYAGPGGVILGGGMSTSISSVADGSCASSPDPIGCLRDMAAGGGQKMPQSRPTGEQGNVAASMPNPVPSAAPEQPGEFEKFVSASVGKPLPIYGHGLFNGVPNTFSPLDNIPVTADYMVGPGDELLVRGWGQVDFDMSVTVDRNGAIYLPRVGNVNVAGIRYNALTGHLKNEIGKVFRNFELNVTLGKLRSIQVFVVGQAKRPGAYTVSSLSTLVNTLFASGGPSVKGSLRRIQVKRNGGIVTELDMYDFLLKGDKTRDIPLQPGDVIYIPPAGQLVAISGSVNSPAIYELKKDTNTLAELIEIAGGLSTVAEGDKVRVERIDDRKMRKVDEFVLNAAGLERTLKDGDVVHVQSISGQFGNAVTMRGNVANPGRYPWKEGMRISDLIPTMDALIVPEYWATQNKSFLFEPGSESELRTQIKRNQNEINWDYALVERLNKTDLTTALLPFNLGKAIGGKDAENNLLLQPGDIVTIFSKEDIQVPSAKRSVYVRLEGEFNHAGVYKALPGETLRQLVARVGGITPQAYLFGSELTREATRQMQQKRLDEIIDRLEADMQRNAAQSAASALAKEDVEASRAQAASQTALIAKMRQVRAIGRIVMDLPDQNPQLRDLPDIVLEDGDRLYIPAPASTVSVMGAVYNQNAFLHKRGQSVGDYLGKAGGPTRDGDEDDVYLVRADGVVFSSRQGGTMFSGFGGREAMPGDTIVVPEKLEKYNLTKDFKDWTQIFYQFAIGIASLKTLGAF